MTTYTAQLWQGGLMVASAASADPGRVEREIRHYAMVYDQDAPVQIRRNKGLKTWLQFHGDTP